MENLSSNSKNQIKAQKENLTTLKRSTIESMKKIEQGDFGKEALSEIEKREKINLLEKNIERIESLIKIADTQLLKIEQEDRLREMEEIKQRYESYLQTKKNILDRKTDIESKNQDLESLSNRINQIQADLQIFNNKYATNFEISNLNEGSEAVKNQIQELAKQYDEKRKNHLENYSKQKIETDFLKSQSTEALLKEIRLLEGRLNANSNFQNEEESRKQKEIIQNRLNSINEILTSRQSGGETISDAEAKPVRTPPTYQTVDKPKIVDADGREIETIKPASEPTPSPVIETPPVAQAPAAPVTEPASRTRPTRPERPQESEPYPPHIRNMALDSVLKFLKEKEESGVSLEYIRYVRGNLETIIKEILDTSISEARGGIRTVDQNTIDEKATTLLTGLQNRVSAEVRTEPEGIIPPGRLDAPTETASVDVPSKESDTTVATENAPQPETTTTEPETTTTEPKRDYRLESNIEKLPDFETKVVDFNGNETISLRTKGLETLDENLNLDSLDFYLVKVGGTSKIDLKKYLEKGKTGDLAVNIEKLVKETGISYSQVAYLNAAYENVTVYSDFSQFVYCLKQYEEKNPEAYQK
jgi:hypothetical protein